MTEAERRKKIADRIASEDAAVKSSPKPTQEGLQAIKEYEEQLKRKANDYIKGK